MPTGYSTRLQKRRSTRADRQARDRSGSGSGDGELSDILDVAMSESPDEDAFAGWMGGCVDALFYSSSAGGRCRKKEGGEEGVGSGVDV